MTRAELARHQRKGSLRAQRALRDLGLDVGAPIDVFGAIEREQVWLMFQPLDRLFGAYRRHDAPGIVVHSGHPVRTQRFTAAHELGHHLLGHDISVDSREEVEPGESSLPGQEVQAQAFAATFLMPVQLVNRALSRVELPRKPNTIDPEQAYRVSLELGSSYAATVAQLRALDRISAANARELHRARPIDIKTQLALGERPANPRADVWPLRLDDSGSELWVLVGDEIHAQLPETPTTGYRWLAEGDDRSIELLGSAPVGDPGTDPRRYGTCRERHLWWRTREPSDAVLEAALRRSFERSSGEPAERFKVALHVQPTPTGEVEHGLSQRQRHLL